MKNKAYTLEKWQGQILYFNEEIKKLKEDRRMIVEAVLLNFLRMTIFYAIPYVAALALQVPLSLSDLINVLLMSACIHMLNALTPLPGDTGWTESAFILIFAVLFGRTEASSVMILWRVATYHIQLIAGGDYFPVCEISRHQKTEAAANSEVSSITFQPQVKCCKYCKY